MATSVPCAQRPVARPTWEPAGGGGRKGPEVSGVPHMTDVHMATLASCAAGCDFGQPASCDSSAASILGDEGLVGQQSPPPTKLLVAAFLGCRACVRGSIDSATTQLLQQAFLAAVKGAGRGGDTAWVQGYLSGKGAAQSSKRADCQRSHNAACSADYSGQPYLLFSAAHDGCRECVRRYIEDDGINPGATSQSGRNALLWAVWGAGNQKDTSWVQGYLEARGGATLHNGTERRGPEDLPQVLSAEERRRVFGSDNAMFQLSRP